MKNSIELELELQKQILNKFYSIDEANKIATIRLTYATFDELVNQNFGDEHIEKLNEKLFKDINEAVNMLPIKYKLNVEILIKDYGTYNKQECEEIILENVRLSLYLSLKARDKMKISGWALIGTGALVLILSYLLKTTKYDILFDIINISGTLFVWEGVNLAFIQRNSEIIAHKKIAKTIQNITIL